MTLPDPAYLPDLNEPVEGGDDEVDPAGLDDEAGRRRVAGNRLLAGAVLLMLAWCCSRRPGWWRPASGTPTTRVRPGSPATP